MNFKQVKRLFIANRGEILRRIALSAQKLGIETAALFQGSEIPSYLQGGLVNYFRLSSSEDVKDYLSIEKMIATAKELGCDAVHPGFGFLSENAEFAAAVIKAGLIWVGPPPAAIVKMASKATASEIADELKIPRVQSFKNITAANIDVMMAEVLAFGEGCGYPLLIKAAYGGGGKGMRVVQNQESLREALIRGASEAKNSFGNDLLVVEKYLPSTRHIEVQILADSQGQVAVIGDRDCSIQRRHQKIIEEAPAPGLKIETRKALHHAAKRLAESVGYQSAGTVEFMLAENNGEQKFYFLEMNTRLQVEHPVSEEVFGIDLVAAQLNIAMGQPLPDYQRSLMPRGHSIEVRLYAEDPENNFFPSPGLVYYFDPMQGPGVRWELGISSGEEITGSFDPMFAKLVVWDEDRNLAIDRLCQALKQTIFFGPKNNLSFLEQVLRDSDFKALKFNTHFLQDKIAVYCENITTLRHSLEDDIAVILAHPPQKSSGEKVQLGAGELSQYIYGNGDPLGGINKSAAGDNRAAQTFHYNLRNQIYFSQSKGSVTKGFRKLDQDKFAPFCYAEYNNAQEFKKFIHFEGQVFTVVEAKELGLTDSGSSELRSHDIESPVPGKIIMVACHEGKEIAKGERLFVLESMKMEYEISASITGTLTKILVKEGESVVANQTLAHWD